MVRVGALAVAVVLVGACDTLGYYSQATAGQLRLLADREPVAELIEDPRTPADLRGQLQLSQALVAFADAELGLAAEGRYDAYVDLERTHVVWNVFATPRFDLAPVRWCYPIAGCVTYRGYFDEARARSFARELEAEGFDVYVGGVAAYSTLGWFDDPLLSSFVHRSEADLAELLFHELAHGRLYVPGDTRFNESFATFVARVGVERWLGPREEALVSWREATDERAAFVAFVLAWRQRMVEAYGAADAAAAPATLEALRSELWSGMRDRWRAERSSGLARYDRFVLAPANNARLNTVADYNGWVPAFAALYGECGDDLEAFFVAAAALAELEPGERARRLDALAGGAQPMTE